MSLASSHAVLALALLAAVPRSAGAAPEATAPLGGGTPGPVRQLFLDPAAADARGVDRASFSARLESVNSWSVPSVFSRDGRAVAVQLDGEADALALAVELPWTLWRPGGWRERVFTIVSWRGTAFWGGFEDGGIEAWHHLAGAYNFTRERYGRDAIHLRLTELGGARAFDLESGRLAWGDLAIGTQVRLAEGGASLVPGGEAGTARWAVAARLELKLPTGSLARLGGSGHPDAGVVLLATRELTPWAVVHGMLLGTVTAPLASPVALQPQLFHGGVDVSLALLAWGFTFLIEDRWLTPLMEGGWNTQDGGDDDVFLSSAYDALFRSHNQISFGLRRGPFTLAFSEDFTLGSNPRAHRSWFFSSNAPDTVLAFTFSAPL